MDWCNVRLLGLAVCLSFQLQKQHLTYKLQEILQLPNIIEINVQATAIA